MAPSLPRRCSNRRAASLPLRSDQHGLIETFDAPNVFKAGPFHQIQQPLQRNRVIPGTEYTGPGCGVPRLFEEVERQIVNRAVPVPDLEQNRSAFLGPPYAVEMGLGAGPRGAVVPHGDQETSPGTQATVALAKGGFDLLIGQQVWNRVVAGDHQVEFAVSCGKRTKVRGDGGLSRPRRAASR